MLLPRLQSVPSHYMLVKPARVQSLPVLGPQEYQAMYGPIFDYFKKMATHVYDGVTTFLNIPKIPDHLDPATKTMEVDTDFGRISGRDEGVLVRFLGIPYARAPRFAPPIPITATCTPEDAGRSKCTTWPADGVFMAHRFGPNCPQIQDKSDTHAIFLPRATDKLNSWDCLNLNVYRPSGAAPKAGWPVLVWVHGGTFAFGSNSDPFNDPSNLVGLNRKMIVVVPNYRLGPFGFMVFGDENETNHGNYAMEDVRTALRWTRDHIKAFGGNPGKVTLGGFSAGGAMVNWQGILAVQSKEVLFHRMYMMSGNYQVVPLMPKEEAISNTQRLAIELKYPGDLNDAAQLREFMKERDEEKVVMKLRELHWDTIFRPIQDGHFIKMMAEDYLDAGFWPDVPAIMTTVSEDASFSVPGESAKIPEGLTPETWYLGMIGSVLGDQDVFDKIQAAYKVKGFENRILERATDVFTELLFRCPDMTMVHDLKEKKHSIWYAEHKMSILPIALKNLMTAPHMGAFHSIDQMVLFGVWAGNLGIFDSHDMRTLQDYMYNFMVKGEPRVNIKQTSPIWATNVFRQEELLRCRHLLMKPGSPMNLMATSQSITPFKKNTAPLRYHPTAEIPPKPDIGMVAHSEETVRRNTLANKSPVSPRPKEHERFNSLQSPRTKYPPTSEGVTFRQPLSAETKKTPEDM